MILENQDWYIQYIYAYYWSVTTYTTVGYGDISPANVYEVVLNILILFISVAVYPYIVNLIGEIIKELNQGKNSEKG
jgi:hypothetical protein